MKKIFTLLIIILLTIPKPSLAQTGQPYITNFSSDIYHGSGQIWAITQGANGLMYFAGNNGIYIYDGLKWQNFRFGNVPAFIVRSLAANGDSLFFGSAGKFGILLPKNIGFETIWLSDSLDSTLTAGLADIWDIEAAGNAAVFTSDSMIFRYNPNFSPQVKLIVKNPHGFTFASKVGGKIFFSSSNFVYRYNPKNDKVDSFKINRLRPWHILPYSQDTVLLVSHQGLFLYSLKDSSIVKSGIFKKAGAYILPLFPYSAIYLPNYKLYAIGTVKGGIIFVNKKGQIIKILDKSKGIIAQTVQSLFLDKAGNLWAGTSAGISVINLSLPFEIFDERNGITGVPYSLLPLDTMVYLGTNTDFFRYDKTKKKFVAVYTPEGKSVQQVFGIYDAKFSDNTHKVLVSSNLGLFEYASRKLIFLTNDAQYFIEQFPQFPDTIYTINDKKLYKIEYKNGHLLTPQLKKIFYNHYFIFLGTHRNNIWLDDNYTSTIAFLNVKSNKLTIVNHKNLIVKGFIDYDTSKVILGTDKGLYEYSYTENKLKPCRCIFSKYLNGKPIAGLEKINDSTYLVLFSYELKTKAAFIKLRKDTAIIDSSIFEPLPITGDIETTDKSLWFITEKNVIKFRLGKYNIKPLFKPVIRKIIINGDSVIFDGTQLPKHYKFVLPYKYNFITIEYSLPSFFNSSKIKFSTSLKGSKEEEWTQWSSDTKREFTNLWEGKYNFSVKARNEFGQETLPTSIEFEILPPWYRTIWAYIFYILILGFFIYFIVKLNARRLEKEKQRLEHLVKLRTVEIEQQKEEIKTQAENLREINQILMEKNEEINQILENLQEANQKITAQNQSIKSSIEYAQKIQNAIILRHNLFDKFFDEYFIFYRPKDIVSGDFYWIDKVRGRIFVAVADCTGHGVPGAFMGMLSYALLTQIVMQYSESTSKILEKLREEIINYLVPKKDKAMIHRDGMDISLIAIDYENRTIEFSGAYANAVMFKNDNFIELKAVKASIGYSRKLAPFKSEFIEFEKGDKIYMFTDGYLDQFGGPDNQKFYRRNFYKLLQEIHNMTMEEQLKIVQTTFEKWKNGYKQTDDVTVIGFKL